MSIKKTLEQLFSYRSVQSTIPEITLNAREAWRAETSGQARRSDIRKR